MSNRTRGSRGWPSVRPSIRMITLLVATLAAFPARAQTAVSLDCGLEAGPTRAVTDVIDGDTIRLDDGKDVRLIGLIAPRAEDVGARRGTWPPEEESRKALSAQLIGKTIALAFLGPRSDRYGRVLAHLFLMRDTSTTWIAGAHLEAGHARAFAAPGQEGCFARLLARERAARNAVRGLWANAAYQVRPADRPGELERYQGTFQIVTGRAAKIGGTRTLVLLDFVSSEAHAEPGSANALNSRNRSAFRAHWNRSVPAISGHRVSWADSNLEVRGWIERRRGPEIQIFGPSQIERVSSAGAPHASEPGTGSGSGSEPPQPPKTPAE